MLLLVAALPVGLVIAGGGIVWLRSCQSLRAAMLVSIVMSLAFAAYIMIFHDWSPCPPESLCALAIESLESITATECDPAPGCGMMNLILLPLSVLPTALFASYAMLRLLEMKSGDGRDQ